MSKDENSLVDAFKFWESGLTVVLERLAKRIDSLERRIAALERGEHRPVFHDEVKWPSIHCPKCYRVHHFDVSCPSVM